MQLFEQRDAKHVGLPPRLFSTCPRCQRAQTWDIRRRRCIVCEWHSPTTSPPAPERRLCDVISCWHLASSIDALKDHRVRAHGATTMQVHDKTLTFQGDPLPPQPREEPLPPLTVVTVQVPAHTRGTDLFHRFCAQLLTAYGGFSQTDVRGSWRDSNGRNVQEGMVRFEIAMSEYEAVNFRLLKVPVIRLMFKQDALYFTVSGRAYIDNG